MISIDGSNQEGLNALRCTILFTPECLQGISSLHEVLLELGQQVDFTANEDHTRVSAETLGSADHLWE